MRSARPVPNGEERLLGSKQLLDLCALPQAVSVDIAVLHDSIAPHDLRYAAEYIRRRLPDAVILVIGEQVKQLDDPLYDDKASSGISIEELARKIEAIGAAKRRIEKFVRILGWVTLEGE